MIIVTASARFFRRWRFFALCGAAALLFSGPVLLKIMGITGTEEHASRALNAPVCCEPEDNNARSATEGTGPSSSVNTIAAARVSGAPGVYEEHGPNINLSDIREQNVISGEWQIRFTSLDRMKQFVSNISGSVDDVVVVGYDRTLLTARIRTENVRFLENLLNEPENGVIEVGGNHRFYTPHEQYPSTSPDSAARPVYTSYGPDSLKAIGVPDMHSSWGSGVTVALVDSGIMNTGLFNDSHVLSVDMLEEAGENSDEIPSSDRDPTMALHGTVMASIIAGSDELLPGVAPEAAVLDIRALDKDGHGDGFTIARGIVSAVDMGADVINLSLAGTGDDMAVRSAVQYALDNGVAVVAASGNSGDDSPAYPARYPGVVAVGAADAAGQHPSFSNTGEDVDISAPGYGIFAALGRDQYVSIDGTSAAAAFVSGSIAGIMSRESVSPMAATGLVMAYASDSGEPGEDSRFGIGLVDLQRIRDRYDNYVDLATAGYFWHPLVQEDPSVPENAGLAVSVQNHGTLAAWNIVVDVTVNGQQARYDIESLEPGQTGSVITILTLQELRYMGTASVTVRVWSSDGDDPHPENNSATYYLSAAS